MIMFFICNNDFYSKEVTTSIFTLELPSRWQFSEYDHFDCNSNAKIEVVTSFEQKSLLQIKNIIIYEPSENYFFEVGQFHFSHTTSQMKCNKCIFYIMALKKYEFLTKRSWPTSIFVSVSQIIRWRF